MNHAFDRRITDPDALLDEYRTLTGWSEALAAAGVRPAVVQRFHRSLSLERNGIEYTFVGDADAARPGAMLRAVAARPADVAHVNGLDYPLETWLLRRLLPAASAIVVQDHASLAPDAASHPRAIRREVRRLTMRAADAFFFCAEEQAEPWRRLNLISPAQQVYPLLESSTRLSPLPRGEARRATGTTGSPALLWVGRLNTNKDPLTVLDGIERCVPKLPSATLTMIFSDDELLPAIRSRLDASPALRARVRLIGRVAHEQMAPYYSAADAFVLGSHHEGSGYALIEACACGLVPIVSDIAAFRAITADAHIGALWPPGDAAGFAAALIRTVRSDAASSRARVRAHFERELSWPAVGSRAFAAYRDVLLRRSA